jgi:hypothetical protein
VESLTSFRLRVTLLPETVEQRRLDRRVWEPVVERIGAVESFVVLGMVAA